MAYDVFISYVEEDGAEAAKLAAGIEASGLGVWYYERDSVPGPVYLQQCQSVIQSCKVVVLIVSRDSLSSRQIAAEVICAHEAQKHFIPLLKGITHAEFTQRQPEWGMALNNATSARIPNDGVETLVPRILEGVRQIVAGPQRLKSQQTVSERTGSKREYDSISPAVSGSNHPKNTMQKRDLPKRYFQFGAVIAAAVAALAGVFFIATMDQKPELHTLKSTNSLAQPSTVLPMPSPQNTNNIARSVDKPETWILIGRSDFDDPMHMNGTAWKRFQEGVWAGEVTNGTYVLRNTTDNETIHRTFLTEVEPLDSNRRMEPLSTEFPVSVEVTAHFMQNEDWLLAGLLFGYDDASHRYLLYGISPSGYLVLTEFEQGGLNRLYSTALVQFSPGKKLTLSIAAEDQSVLLFCDDRLIRRVGLPYVPKGLSGVAAVGKGSFAFDNFNIYRISDSSYFAKPTGSNISKPTTSTSP